MVGVEVGNQSEGPVAGPCLFKVSDYFENMIFERTNCDISFDWNVYG